ncbi:MAG: phosphotransferase family protein [Candidatus Saccharibacteria bacterium]
MTNLEYDNPFSPSNLEPTGNVGEDILEMTSDALAIAGITTAADLQIISTTAHAVLSDNQSTIVKVPFVDSPIAYRVTREYESLNAFEIFRKFPPDFLPIADLQPRTAELADGRTALVTNYLGEIVSSQAITEDMATSWALAVGDLHRFPLMPPYFNQHLMDRLLALGKYHDSQQRKYGSLPEDNNMRRMAQPLSDNLMNGLGTSPAKILRTPLPYDPPRRLGSITHGDLNMRNFVVDSAGKLSLIDWEACYLGPPEADIALMALDCHVTGRRDLWPTILDVVKQYKDMGSPLTFDWCFRANLASSIAHVAWKGDEAGLEVRANIYEDYVAGGPEWLIGDFNQYY